VLLYSDVDISDARADVQLWPGAALRGSVDELRHSVSELFHALRGRVFQYLLVILGNPSEAEEITQECFLRLYQHLRDGNAVENAKVWLFHVARNLALDKKRASRFVGELDPPAWDKVILARQDLSPTPEQGMLQKERYDMVREALRRLTDQEQQVLHLRAKGLSYREIAEVMELSINAVAAHIHRGLEKIKGRLHV
jgi:RNA polymerase sigma-70 factor (ECF subfamily)